jgi:hypothetical protein
MQDLGLGQESEKPLDERAPPRGRKLREGTGSMATRATRFFTFSSVHFWAVQHALFSAQHFAPA